MTLSRREFIATTAAVAAMSTIRPSFAAASETTFFEWKPVATGVRTAIGYGGNSTVIDGKSVAYIIDTKNAPWGKALLREAAPAAKKVVVINSHHHPDHTGGNHAFTKDHTVYAHEKCLPRIAGNMSRYISQVKEGLTEIKGASGPAIDKVKLDWNELHAKWEKLTVKEFTPTKSIGDEKSFDEAGGAKLSAHHFGPGHTDNDLVIHLKETNVLIAADLLFRRMHPYIDTDGGGDTVGWVASLKKAIELCDAKTKVIPGHGEICGVDGLKEQVEYFEKSRDFVAKGIKAGKSRKDIAESKPPFFSSYAKEDRRSMALLAIYDELTDKK